VSLVSLSPYAALWLSALGKTLLIEVGAGALLLSLLGKRAHTGLSFKPPRDLWVLTTATLITHPPLWFIWPSLCRQWRLSYMGYLLTGEALVTLIEALWYASLLTPLKAHFEGNLKGRHLGALALSTALNTLSYTLGLLWT
jgi:hypothetical protein